MCLLLWCWWALFTDIAVSMEKPWFFRGARDTGNGDTNPQHMPEFDDQSLAFAMYDSAFCNGFTSPLDELTGQNVCMCSSTMSSSWVTSAWIQSNPNPIESTKWFSWPVRGGCSHVCVGPIRGWCLQFRSFLCHLFVSFRWGGVVWNVAYTPPTPLFCGVAPCAWCWLDGP